MNLRRVYLRRHCCKRWLDDGRNGSPGLNGVAGVATRTGSFSPRTVTWAPTRSDDVEAMEGRMSFCPPELVDGESPPDLGGENCAPDWEAQAARAQHMTKSVATRLTTYDPF